MVPYGYDNWIYGCVGYSGFKGTVGGKSHDFRMGTYRFKPDGSDGAVWFADWQNFIIQHNPTPSVDRGGYDAETGAGGAHENPLRDHSRGRIYRVVWDKAPAPAKIASLQNASTADLVKALGSDTQVTRLTAQRLLVDGKKTDAAEALKKIVAAMTATARGRRKPNGRC